MLILPRDLPPTWHMSLKQFILTVGLLIALAASETKAQAGTGNSSFATSVTTETSPAESGDRFCNYTQYYVHRTRCTECDYSEFEPCNAGHHYVLNESCEVRFPFRETLPGCRAACLETRIEYKCCKGYWGKECNECPGGSQKPCNGHGRCLVRSGRCICYAGFHGKACELCTNKNKYGPDCSKDCTCAKWECNSGVHGDGACAPENPCNNSVTPCGLNSHCLHTGPGTHVCVCDEGYDDSSSEGSGSDTTSDGDCVPDDPCMIKNGGCDNTQVCIPQGTGKWHCRCKKGYNRDLRAATCILMNMCKPEICGDFAYCETREPLKYSCVCRGNYTWNGLSCSSNIIEVLGDLSAGDDKFVGTLRYMYNMTSRVYGTLLARRGPFTIFVPTDKAFREVFGDTLQELFTDDVHMKKVLRYHIVIGQFSTAMPRNMYTLQGYAATLNNSKGHNRKVSHYYVQGPDNRLEASVITAADIVASNGVIHIIDSVMGNKDNLFDKAKTAMDLIDHNPEYKTMSLLIRKTASSEIFSKPNTTVFISDNRAWAWLSHEERDYLISDPNGLEELRVILEHHVYPGVVDIANLINRQTMESYANINVNVIIGRSGYIQLDNGGAKLSLTDIPCSTGLCYRVDKVLVPAYLKPLKKVRCEVNLTHVVQGKCRDCSIHMCSVPGDVPTERKKRCPTSYFLDQELGNYTGPHQDAIRESYMRRHSSPKCFETCYRVFTTSGCCAGFYGQNCLACPGGARNVCSGNGVCDDGNSGTGKCTCNMNFTGTSCDQCTEKYKFGPRCDQRCTCQFGTCDSGIGGSGKCQPGTCQLGYSGVDCDQKLTPCESDDACQLNAKCYRGSYGDISCYCAPGYEEDGDNCEMIDLCRRNPCDAQATCSQDEPGVTKCTCNHGWHGDGSLCLPNSPCNNDSHCHGDAVCHNSEPGQFRCVCKPGYEGNGKDCVLGDLCILNDGNCHKVEDDYILEFSDHPEWPPGVRISSPTDQAVSNPGVSISSPNDQAVSNKDDHSLKSHDQALSNPAIAGVTAAVVFVLVALLPIVIYKKWKRSSRQPSTNLECSFEYSQIGRDQTEDSVGIPVNMIYQPSV